MPFPDPIQVINPRTGNPFTSRANNASLIKAAAEQGLAQYQGIAMQGIVQKMVAEASGEVGNALLIFGESLRYKFSSSREYEMRNIHLKAGQAAQRAMLNRYRKVVVPRSVGDYRSDAPGKWKRYSGGKLERALASPNFFRASKDGILWGLKEPLDAAAPQWYRLNYGAGPRGQGNRAQQAFPVDASGLNLIPKTFTASGAYMMPQGVFGDISDIVKERSERRPRRVDITSIRGGARLGRRLGKVRGSPSEFGPSGFVEGKPADQAGTFSSSPFHPIGYVNLIVGRWDGPTVGPVRSRGFAGAFFIEAGMKRMGQALPASYKGLMRRWLREAAQTTPSGPITQLIDTPTANTYLKAVETNIEFISYQKTAQFYK